MSTLSNPDSVDNGFFKPKIQPSKPLRDDGHKPGSKHAPGDYKPEFHAQNYPPGTAPASSSYIPNPISDPGSQALNPNVDRGHGKEEVRTSAEQTMTGATSKDVHDNLGHPNQRGIEREEAKGGQHGNKGTSAAEDIPPQPAERAAKEWKYEPGTKRDNAFIFQFNYIVYETFLIRMGITGGVC